MIRLERAWRAYLPDPLAPLLTVVGLIPLSEKQANLVPFLDAGSSGRSLRYDDDQVTFRGFVNYDGAKS